MDLQKEVEKLNLLDLKWAKAIALARFLGYVPANPSKFGPDPILSCTYLYAQGWDWDEERLAWLKTKRQLDKRTEARQAGLMNDEYDLLIDVMAKERVDDQRINQEIYDALTERIDLRGLTLTVVTRDGDRAHSSQFLRTIKLDDGYCYAEVEVKVELLDQGKYMDHLAYQLVINFARERYLIKR